LPSFLLLRDIIEGRMKGKAYRGSRRLHILNDLTSSSKYSEVRRGEEDREGWRATEGRGIP